MGDVRHHAIVVTSWQREVLYLAAAKARELGLEVLGPSAEVTNGFATFIICPDGSNEGWDESDEFDAKREKFVAYLKTERYKDGSSCLAWVVLAYGSDDQGGAKIIKHAWQDLQDEPQD